MAPRRLQFWEREGANRLGNKASTSCHWLTQEEMTENDDFSRTLDSVCICPYNATRFGDVLLPKNNSSYEHTYPQALISQWVAIVCHLSKESLQISCTR